MKIRTIMVKLGILLVIIGLGIAILGGKTVHREWLLKTGDKDDPETFELTHQIIGLGTPWTYDLGELPSGTTVEFYYKWTNPPLINVTHIVINEVELNPPGKDEGFQWIELYNPTNNEIDISGWTISTTHYEKVTITIPQGIKLSNNTYFLVSYESLWLQDRDESIILRDALGEEIDRTPLLTDTFDDSRTWQRYPNGQDTDSAKDWSFRLNTKGLTNGSPIVYCGFSHYKLLNLNTGSIIEIGGYELVAWLSKANLSSGVGGFGCQILTAGRYMLLLESEQATPPIGETVPPQMIPSEFRACLYVYRDITEYPFRMPGIGIFIIGLVLLFSYRMKYK
jgi:hypothetical protein